jgi:threonine synthase
LCPESAVCLDCLETLRAEGWVKEGDEVVLFNTGAAQKYPEAVHEQIPLLDIQRPIDWDQI